MSRARPASLVDGLMTPVRLVERAVDALGELPTMTAELTRMREQTANLPDLLPILERVLVALQPLEDRLEKIEATMHEVAARTADLERTLVGVKDDIEHVPGIPADEAADERPGLIERARDAIAGDAEPDRDPARTR